MRLLLLSLVGLVFVIAPGEAAVLPVPSVYPTIQSGINNANSGDTVLVADGFYSGQGNIFLNFGGHDIVLRSENGPDNCIINCLSEGQAFFFHSGETEATVLSGFMILYGFAGSGGAIHIVDSNPTIEHCIFWLNTADQGGGIYIANADPRIINCTFVENAAANGGAIYLVNSDVLIKNCIIQDNYASG